MQSSLRETGDVWLRVRSQAMADEADRVLVRIEVEDTGPGIPHDRLNDVFDSFVQIEQDRQTEKGTGLGLAISTSLIDMMGGKILLQSEAGQGALFTVTLPLQIAEAGALTSTGNPVAEVIGLQAGQPEWRILVVDDNPENRLLLSELLVQAGFTVREAKNGEAAITIFQDWQPHLIWMDMRMPVLDGYAATKRIRALPGGDAVKIVAITASVLAEQEEKILESGCDDMLRKPFRSHEIFEAMARQLDLQYRYKGEKQSRCNSRKKTFGQRCWLNSLLN